MHEDGATPYEIALTHFIVSDDVERSVWFYTEVRAERAWCRVPHATERAPNGGPLLRTGPRWPSN